MKPLLFFVAALCLPVSAHAEEHPHGGGLVLPGGLLVNGRFDINYERTRFSDNPTEGKNALKNYHHFVFLSREAKEDPYGFTAELVDLTFYEVFARYSPRGAPYRLGLNTGKILVPFGAEPLFHHSYGGVSGFDQRFLPVVWAQPGVRVNVQFALEDLGIRLSNDLYAVRGHELRGADSVLDLASDFSPLDDVRLAVGDRLSASYGPLSVWYSVYFQDRIGARRRLFMQALDLSVWRIPDVPILEDLSLSAGIVRADVSQGGAGEDYYHFADYITLRYYPFEWLYVQLRGGLRTMNNRRGYYLDETRRDANDEASYNIGVVATHAGLTGAVYYFRNTEIRDEQDDDLMRLSVTYEF